MTETEKLRALLREAAGHLRDFCPRRCGICPDCTMQSRIESALAASEADVTWKVSTGGLVQEASVGGFHLLVEQRPWCWRWRTAPVFTYGWDGECRTLEEAKAAALDAVGKQP